MARPSTVAKKTETVSSKLTAPAKRRVTARRERVAVPKLLLEGDAPLIDKISPAGPGGMAQILGPTGGFLMAYPLAAFVCGEIFEAKAQTWQRRDERGGGTKTYTNGTNGD